MQPMEVKMKTLRIILRYSNSSFQQSISNIPVFLLFTLSKFIRYGLFVLFLYSLFNGLASVGGYTRYQMLLFYLMFNVVDTTSQMLFREVYRFRQLVSSGGFDMVLTKPFSPLIRVLLGGPDMIDLGMLIMVLWAIVYILLNSVHPSLEQILLSTFLIFNSLIITAAFHIFVLGIGIMSLSVDHLVMIYRDLTSLARIPVDIFTEPLRFVITFIVPLGIMFTFPAKALFGLLSWQTVGISVFIGFISLFLSIKFWQWSLQYYQSASS